MLLTPPHAAYPQAAQAVGTTVPDVSVAATARSRAAGEASDPFSLMLSGVLSSKQSGSAATQVAADNLTEAGMQGPRVDADPMKADGHQQVGGVAAKGQPSQRAANPVRQVAKHDVATPAVQSDAAIILPVVMTVPPLALQPQTTPASLKATADSPAHSAGQASVGNIGSLPAVQMLDRASVAVGLQASGQNRGADLSGGPAGRLAETGSARTGNAKLGEAKLGDAKPGDAKPGDAKLSDAKPGDAKPGDAKLVDVKPFNVKPGDAKLADLKPGDTKPGDTKPVGVKPVSVKSGDTKPGDTKPGDTKPGDTKPGDAKPGDAKPGDAKPGDAKPGDAKSGDAKPVDVKPGDVKPGDAKPSAQRGRGRTEAPVSGHAARALIMGGVGMPLASQDAGQPSRVEPAPPVQNLGVVGSMGAVAIDHSRGSGNSLAASTGADPGGQPPPPAAQLGQAFAKIHTSADGSSHVTIRLDPLELGSVEVRISRAHNGSASVSVVVERPETLRSLQADLVHLHQALDRVGLPDQRSLVLHLAPQENVGSSGQGGAATTAGHSGFQQDGSQQGRGGAAAPSRFPAFGDATDHEPNGRTGSVAGPGSRWLRAGINITA